MEGIPTGPPGLSVVSHVVMELNSVIDHAPIHRLNSAKDLLKKHEFVPSKCAQRQVTSVSHMAFQT